MHVVCVVILIILSGIIMRASWAKRIASAFDRCVGKLDLADPDGVGATGLRRRRGTDEAKRKHGGEDGNATSSQAPPHLILGPRPNTAMVPLPLTSISPRGSDSNRAETCSQTSLVTATRPGVAWSDMRAATFTVSPQMSN